MERIRRGPDDGSLGRTRPPDGPARRPRSLTDEILDLQASAGNRSVAAAISEASVQREEVKAPSNHGGLLTLDTGEVIPFQGAHWSVTQKIATHYLGRQRAPEITGGNLEYGSIAMFRTRDDRSPRMDEILNPKERAKGTLVINQRSADGGLPATRLDLSYVAFREIRVDDDDSTEVIFLDVERLTAAGLVGEDTKAGARAKAAAVATLGLDGKGATPTLRWEIKGGKPEPGSRSQQRGPAEPLTVELAIPAGKTFDRLVASLDGEQRFDVSITASAGGTVFELYNALLAKVQSAGDPGIVEVLLTGEGFRERRSKE